MESFNNRLRNDYRNRNHRTSPLEAKLVVGSSRDDRNHRHRHSSLDCMPPADTLPKTPTTTIWWTDARSTALRQSRL
ncbi:integrase core domain-containing protein [Rhodococcus sp. P1Y]|uniref:integrase core domain-containing protein n=1 Tax=Rhodococcus sp. P1Y TaxID=1302308 RepID=UPI000EAC5B8D|nr:hypothetical protein D8W71_02170 [Rhodococcus sp. P1Y]